VLVLLALFEVGAHAQVASILPPAAETSPSWSFAITPYIWLPAISANLRVSRPRGGAVDSNVGAGIGDYISDLNFALMLGGMARYGRFSVLTDLVYVNASLTSDVSRLSSVNLGPGPIDIRRGRQIASGTRMAETVWSLAGGYTLLEGRWGNLDAVGGLRMLNLGSTSNFQLTANIQGPNNAVALTRGGGLTIDANYVDAIGGVTGRINILNSKFYLPFYIDAGGGALPFTWQVYSGVAYKATTWADISIGYRYLAFRNGRSTGVRNLSFAGAILAANVHF
jgi:hypothetical protein